MFSATMRLDADSVDKQRREEFVNGILAVRLTTFVNIRWSGRTPAVRFARNAFVIGC